MVKRKLRFGAFLIAAAILMISVARLLSSEEIYRKTSGEYIKWVDFKVTAEAMNDALEISLDAYQNGYKADFVELLSYLGAKYGGEFKYYKKSDITSLYSRIKNGESIDSIGASLNYYPYYLEAYGAVLREYVGEFYIDGKPYYGLRAFSPIAKGYNYNHSDDFGNSRSYGFNRKHLGHDMIGSVGTPIIATESGYVEALGWNQYGGWRIGIRSFDNQRYYYYAHLR
ncbi:MAG: M23 family metallopeptidase, partial [Clostridia bacterium]|nr:M23 family metallopeptidase [Clostridia bacterium]